MVGHDGIKTFVLQIVRLQFIDQPNSPPLLTQINEHASVLFYVLQRRSQLLAAIATSGPKDVAREALGVNADIHNLAANTLIVQYNVRHFLPATIVCIHHKLPVNGGQTRGNQLTE